MAGPSFLRLSEEVLTHLLSFCEQWHVGTLLSTSTAVRAVVAPTIRAFKPALRLRDKDTRDPCSLGRLLDRLLNLRRLHLHGFLLPEERKVLMRALEHGAVGKQLEELRVRSVDEWVVALLVTLIREGGLPKLQKLRFDQGEHAQERFFGGLARAMKARRERGLPPLTDLEGMAEAGTPTPTSAGRELISIWGCCPAEAQECLEAADARQISALEEYVGGTGTDLFALVGPALDSPLDAEEEDVGSTSTDFSALRILRLVGSRGWGREPVPFEFVGVGVWADAGAGEAGLVGA